jgi:hypothetical protein
MDKTELEKLTKKLKHSLDPKHVSKRITICEIHRLIFLIVDKDPEDITQEDREQIKRLCMVAFDMGKRMSVKLQSYKSNWDDGWWKDNPLWKRPKETKS